MLNFALWLESFDYEANSMMPQLVQSNLDKKGKYKVVIVDVSKFDKAWSQDRGMYLPPGGKGDNYIPIHSKPDYNRYDRVGEELPKFREMNKPFEMSTVGLRHGIPAFTDGRHRFAYFRDKGIRYLPVSVHKDDWREMQRLFGVNQ